MPLDEMYLNLTTGIFPAMPGSLPCSTSAGQPLLLLRNPLHQCPAAPGFREQARQWQDRLQAEVVVSGTALEVSCE